MALTTRKLTGQPSWPITLLAGGEKVGKTWAAVEASTSPLVSRCLWFPMGEDDPDELALIPGFDPAKFDLVEHDGSYRGLMSSLMAANALPAEETPTLWVLDSGSRTWDLLSGMAQREANQRRKADDLSESRITPDLWNTANDRWSHVMNEFRVHWGPVIITSRMETVMVVDAQGNPTKEKQSKVLAQKRLPYDVGSIVEMPARGEAWLTGTRSVKLSQMQPRVKFPDFTFDALWRRLGLADGDVGTRVHSGLDVDDHPMLEADQARVELGGLCDEHGWDRKDVAALWLAQTEDEPLHLSANAAAINEFGAELLKNGLPGKAAA